VNTLKWLGFVAVLAIALAVIRWFAGDSILGFAAFFIAVMGAHEYVRGSRQWGRAVLGGAAAPAFYGVGAHLLR